MLLSYLLSGNDANEQYRECTEEKHEAKN
jgi:hypothetical protein